jgi:hypothetical protein
MFARFLGAGVASLVTMALIGVGIMMRADAHRATPPQNATSTLARTLTRAVHSQADIQRIGWTVTRATSAHHMMVVDVEARRLDEAKGIASQIVEPVRSRGYEEILIYVRQPGMREPAVRRIQWTPRGGYVETSYADR